VAANGESSAIRLNGDASDDVTSRGRMTEEAGRFASRCASSEEDESLNRNFALSSGSPPTSSIVVSPLSKLANDGAIGENSSSKAVPPGVSIPNEPYDKPKLGVP